DKAGPVGAARPARDESPELPRAFESVGVPPVLQRVLPTPAASSLHLVARLLPCLGPRATPVRRAATAARCALPIPSAIFGSESCSSKIAMDRSVAAWPAVSGS